MSKTLLLADDSVTIQKVVGISFANEDVKLVTVDNGDDALVKARELRPDIVLADVVMPGMNGYEVCEAIRSDPALRSIPVLLLTGTFEAFDEERATRAGADGHITKPFEAQALVDQVNARLAASAARQVEPEAPSPVPSAAPSPAAASASESSPFDSGFDFLQEEETTEPSGLQSSDHGSTTTVLLQDDLDVEPDDAFGFEAPDHVHEELSVSADFSPSLPEEPMPTVQRMDPEQALTPGPEEDSLFGDDSLHEAETMPPVGMDEPPVASPARAADGDATRVVVNEAAAAAPVPGRPDALTSVMPADLAGETVLDPSGARDYDVSSSDLGDVLAAGPDGDLTPPLPPQEAHGRMEAASAPAPLEENPSLGESFAASELEADLSPPSPEPPRPAPSPALPRPAPADVSAVRPAAEGAGPAPSAASARPAAAADLSPEARQQLHDALEKAAWEAFGDVTERIVRDAVARIEQVAWEVIPQMAENVIREEIRRLKEES